MDPKDAKNLWLICVDGQVDCVTESLKNAKKIVDAIATKFVNDIKTATPSLTVNIKDERENVTEIECVSLGYIYNKTWISNKITYCPIKYVSKNNVIPRIKIIQQQSSDETPDSREPTPHADDAPTDVFPDNNNQEIINNLFHKRPTPRRKYKKKRRVQNQK